GPDHRVDVLRPLQRRGEAGAPFLEVTLREPEPVERPAEPEGGLHPIRRLRGPVGGGAEIRGVVTEPDHPVPVRSAAEEPRSRPFRAFQIRSRVTRPDLLVETRRLEPLEAILPDRLEEPVAGLEI